MTKSKGNSWIARFILWTTLLAVVLAMWIAVRVLREPPPGLDSGELDSLRESIASSTNAIFTERESAIENLGASGAIDARSPYSPVRFTSTGSGFETARSRAMESLQPGTGIPMNAGLLPPMLEISESLNAADAIYRAESAAGSRISETELRGTLVFEMPLYIRLLGYKELRQTLGRDMIRYQVLESLRFHELKDTLYHSESDTNEGALYLARQGAYARRDSGLSVLDHRYTSYIQVLVHQLNSDWTSAGSESGMMSEGSGMLDDIRVRIDGFSPSIGPAGRAIEPGPVPSKNIWAWLASEAEISTEFEAALEGETSG